ncbi:MAG: YbhB/YbcL family Raf kinase inhibitor-like protein [Alphaproteobacteria bacterium]
MKKTLILSTVMPVLWAVSALAQTAALEVKIAGIDNGKPIPEKFAYCAPDGKGKSKSAPNINPQISWSGAPAGTKSYAILVVDTEVPATFDDANQDGKTIAADFPRQDFYHWVLVNVPASITKIAEGQDSNGTPEGGKPVGKTAYGVNLQNDYTKVFKGSFGGYDGPCPPWNDARLHQYHFSVYALSADTVNIAENATGKQVLDTIKPYVLAEGKVTGTYTQNAELLK